MENLKNDKKENSKTEEEMQYKNDNYLKSTLQSFNLNIDNSIKLAENKLEKFSEQLKLITKNFIKGGKNISNIINDFVDRYKNAKNRIDNKLNFITEFQKTNPNQQLSLTTIKEECKINTYITQEHNNFTQNIDKINLALKNLENIFNSKDFKEFMEVTKKIIDKDDTLSEVSDNDENISLEEENNNNNNNNTNNNKNKVINKKRKREDKNEQKVKKRKMKTVRGQDLITKLKRKYPNSKYIKKLTKTFIQRRLNHKIIYEHHFEYSSTEYKDNKIKTSGDKTSYKYIKFNLEVNSIEKVEKVINKIKPEFKDGYFYLEYENKINFELSGKIIQPLFTLIKNIFNNIPIIKELGIVKAKIYAYEFYEELAHEYQKPESNKVKIEINSKTTQKLFDNYNMLNIVREFVMNNKK